MPRLTPVADLPPTLQEQVIIKILKTRPDHGWTLEALLEELSKGRAIPMSYSALGVHVHNLRHKGFPITRQVVYTMGGLTTGVH